MVTLVKGTVENIPVDVADVLGALETIEGHDGVYYVRLRSGADWLVDGESVVVNPDTPLRAYCPIDSTGVDWVVGFYQIFVQFDLTPETPRVGPVEFKLAHDMPEIALGE